MRRLAAIEFLTLDGVMQGLGSPDEDREGGFEHGGWSAPYGDEVARKATGGAPAASAYLFGRKTYQLMAAHWPHESAQNPIAAHLNTTPKYVVTSTLTHLEWAGSHVLHGDVPESVARLKAEGDGTIVVLGSGVLVQSLMEHNLIDQYRLFIHPLVLGTGKRLFGQKRRPLSLRLVECTTTTAGVLLLNYEPA